MLVDNSKSYYICFRGKNFGENNVNGQWKQHFKARSQTLIPD